MKSILQFVLKESRVLFLLAFMLPAGVSFSLTSHSQPDQTLFSIHSPAHIKKVEKADKIVYTFKAIAEPDKTTLDKSMDRFRQIEGFISLTVNAQNEVELITAKTVAEKDNTRLLLISARLYGYIGYNIVE